MTVGSTVQLAVIGDVHAHRRLELVLEHLRGDPLDALLLVGDLARDPPPGQPASAEAVVQVVARAETLDVPVFFVPGNHDPPEVPHPGNIDGRVVELAGLRLGGLGGAGPARFGFPYEWSEVELRCRPRLDVDVLLVHAPPRNTPIDRTVRGQYAGSLAIRERAEALRGVLFCGHVHESPGAVRLGSCLCVNAGGLGPPFGAAQVVRARVTRTGGGLRWEIRHERIDGSSTSSWNHEIRGVGRGGRPTPQPARAAGVGGVVAWSPGGRMPYDAQLAARIRDFLAGTPLLTEKKMFGGIGWMIGGHMAAGAHSDGRLMIRCPHEETPRLAGEPGAGAMERGGKPVAGWVLVDADAVAEEEGLARWVGRGRDFAAGLPPRDKGR